MDKTMTLSQAVKIAESKISLPIETPRFNKLGDYLEIFFDEELNYAERIDGILTVFRSVEDGAINGCKICNVSTLAKNASTMLEIKDDEVQLRFLLLSAMSTGPGKDYYYDLSERAGSLTIGISDMLDAA